MTLGKRNNRGGGKFQIYFSTSFPKPPFLFKIIFLYSKKRISIHTVVCLHRAGADVILTYAAKEYAQMQK